MIVKNEEKNLEACLNSAHDLVEEVNIVDTGSEDNTLAIANRYTERVFHFDWANDFSKARNFSFSKATKDYILWLDADDIITEENRRKILKLKKTLKKDVSYVNMLYHYTHDENGKPSTVTSRERLVKRSEGFLWRNKIHENIDVSGKCLNTDIFITHNHSDEESRRSSLERNLRIIEQSAKDADADSITLSHYIISLYKLGRIDEAYEQAMRLLSRPKAAYETRLFLSIYEIFTQKGEYEAALNVLLDNEHYMKDKSEYYCVLGSYFFNRMQDLDKALECYKKALLCKGREASGVFSARNESFYYFEPLRSIANCYIKLKRYDMALEYWEKAIKYNPNDNEGQNIVKKLRQLTELMKKHNF